MTRSKGWPLCCFFFFLSLLTAVPGTYGSSQGYTAVIAKAGSSHIYNPYYSLWQCQIFKPLSKARDRTHILTETNIRSLTHQATVGTPIVWFLPHLSKLLSERIRPAPFTADNVWNSLPMDANYFMPWSQVIWKNDHCAVTLRVPAPYAHLVDLDIPDSSFKT